MLRFYLKRKSRIKPVSMTSLLDPRGHAEVGQAGFKAWPRQREMCENTEFQDHKNYKLLHRQAWSIC